MAIRSTRRRRAHRHRHGRRGRSVGARRPGTRSSARLPTRGGADTGVRRGPEPARRAAPTGSAAAPRSPTARAEGRSRLAPPRCDSGRPARGRCLGRRRGSVGVSRRQARRRLAGSLGECASSVSSASCGGRRRRRVRGRQRQASARSAGCAVRPGLGRRPASGVGVDAAPSGGRAAVGAGSAGVAPAPLPAEQRLGSASGRRGSRGRRPEQVRASAEPAQPPGRAGRRSRRAGARRLSSSAVARGDSAGDAVAGWGVALSARSCRCSHPSREPRRRRRTAGGDRLRLVSGDRAGARPGRLGGPA